MSVIVCNEYSAENPELQKVFESYPYELSDFQKHSIDAIFNGKSSLITAGTGSGKTLPAEYAIKRNHEKGLKTIYTSPIKALSNQKYNEFTEKYPDISFGLITGDIKCNPNADCLIMTCEILRNHLFNMKYLNKESATYFEMDFENELGSVVFDEIHYINDRERGSVWEESIMALPKNVFLVMLSATMKNPENFAEWVSKVTNTDVYLSGSPKRIVPLTHYSFMVFSESNRKTIEKNISYSLVESDKEVKNLVSKFNKKLIPIKDSNGFSDKTYYDMKKILDFTNKKNLKTPVKINKVFVLNETANFLKEKDMLPAIFFSLSRKNCEYYASLIQENLYSEEESIKTSIAENECKQILMKLPNSREYIENPEFTKIVALLQKGVAYHHSGLLSVYREMVEIMFAKGFVKLLFATETFSVGINLPTKTVVFDSFQKFDGSQRRILKSHEYTQMAGRAGRRGLDTVGNVLHLTNISQLPFINEYRDMLTNNPAGFSSKFKLDFSLILRLIKVSKKELGDFVDFIESSFYQREIQNEIQEASNNLKKASKELQDSTSVGNRTPPEIFEEYVKLHKEFSNENQRKKQIKIKRKIENLEDYHKNIKKDFQEFLFNDKLNKNKNEKSKELESIKTYIPRYIEKILEILRQNDFIDESNGLLEKGLNASNIQEVHSLAFSEILEDLEDFSEEQLVGILSTFTSVSIPDDDKVHLESSPESLRGILSTISEKYDKYNDIELKNQINSSFSYELQYDTCQLMMDWCFAENEQDCKKIIQEANKSGIYLGSFIKAILKINNLVNEISSCNISISLRNKLSKIPEKTLKYVVTNQSLYI